MGDDEEDFVAAFDQLYRRAFLVARRILFDATSAEDVAAEALARAYAHWGRIGGQPWREGWVVRVATNEALRTVRRRSRFADRDGGELDRVGEDADVATRLALVGAMARLPRRQREVVALRHLAGLSEAECASTLRVAPGTVKTHLHRGLAALRSRLGPDAGFERVLVDV